ncbi:Hypothetical protein R9X50_00778800 [Acrodontium crateriforme]|uniref:TEA domain-containing protein n=1 Tax=Acrodontium crateriforme TaxID=150365 RepID=A0AAQ3RCI0_9PEZI|nr:Hypothetical protein R9X50_00778800 [Acrodontium crateriforme]
MMLPARVLPSNASPPQNNANLPGSSRALRERSINFQHDDDHVTSNFENYKYQGYPQYIGNDWHGSFPRGVPNQPLHPPEDATPVRQWQNNDIITRGHHSQAQHARLHRQADNRDKRLVRLGRELVKRARAAEAYSKYRDKPPTKGKPAKDGPKWSDSLEEAFFEALVKYPPMGRKKLWHIDKLKGRNELVAHHIFELTGQERSRKQVSSHIQVLRPFLLHDPLIMKYVSNPENDKSSWAQGTNCAIGRRSNHPIGSVTCSQSTLPPSISDADKLERFKHELALFEPTGFSIFVQRNLQQEDRIEKLHTYCQSIERPLGPDIPPDSWQAILIDFPFLAEMHGRKPLDCNILVAEASLALPSSSFKDENGNGLSDIELGISFSCGSRHLSSKAKVQCQSTFYRNGHQAYISTSDTQFAPSIDGHSVETPIKFGSVFWAKTLASLANRLKEPADSVDTGTESVASLIKGITAVQEFIILPDTLQPQSSTRILIVLWRFRLASTSRGQASWQKVMAPSTMSPWPEATSSPTNYPEPPKMINSIPLNSFNPTSFATLSATWNGLGQTTYPNFESPFQYDSGSAVSGLSSVSWPTTGYDAVEPMMQNVHPDFSAENNFEFNGSNTNIAYDAMDLTDLNNAAFSFDVSNVEFATDPSLNQYSQAWDDSSYAHGYHNKHMISSTERGYETLATDLNDISRSQSHAPSQSQSQPQSRAAYSACGIDTYSQNFDDSQDGIDSQGEPTYSGNVQHGLEGGNGDEHDRSAMTHVIIKDDSEQHLA